MSFKRKDFLRSKDKKNHSNVGTRTVVEKLQLDGVRNSGLGGLGGPGGLSGPGGSGG